MNRIGMSTLVVLGTLGVLTLGLAITADAARISAGGSVDSHVHVWDGGSFDSNLWSDPWNWSDDTAPEPGDDLVFGVGAAQLEAVNDFDPGTSFRSLTLEDGYTLSGNAIALPESGSVTATAGNSTISVALFVPPNPIVPPNPVRVTAGSGLELAGVISGAADLQKLGEGLLVLSAANTFSGRVTVAEGTLCVRNDLALGSPAGGTELLIGTTLEISGGVAVAVELLTLNASPTDPCRLLSTGGENLWGGPIAAPTDPCRVVTFTSLALTGEISGGGFEKLGDATLVLSAANTFGGPVTVAEGTLSVRNDLALGSDSGGTELLAGVTLELSGGIAVAGESLALHSTPVDPCRLVSVAGDNVWNGTIAIPTDPCRFETFTNLELAGGISGDGGLEKLGDATLVLSAANTFSGPVTVAEGTLSVRHDLALGSDAGGTEMLAGTTLELSGGIAVAGESLTLRGAPVDPCRLASIGGSNLWGGPVSIPVDPCRVATFTNLELAGEISGDGGFEKLGDAMLVLSGTSPDYGGSIDLLAGTLVLSGELPGAQVDVRGGTLSSPGTLGALILHGTDDDDMIRVGPVARANTVEVVINGARLGSFPLTQRLVLRAGAGDDDLQVAGSVDLSVWLDGGSGNDRLKSGAGNDVLLGGTGSDMILSGAGRDLVIGGAGSDRIVGNPDDDLLISGRTDFDPDDAALIALLAEWTSARSYATRVANLRGTGSGGDFDDRENADSFLATDGPSATVHDDGAVDMLTGSAGQDWFFANTDGDDLSRDRVTDQGPGELADDVD